MRPSGLLHSQDNYTQTPDIVASVAVSTALVTQAYPAGAAFMVATANVGCYVSWSTTNVSSGGGSSAGSSGNAVYLAPNFPRFYQLNVSDATGNGYSVQGATAATAGYLSLEFFKR